VRHAFESSEFIKTAMSAVYDETFTSNDKKREDMLKLFSALGAVIVPQAVNQYLGEGGGNKRYDFLRLLELFPHEGIREAMTRLNDPSVIKPENLFEIINKLITSDITPNLIPYLEPLARHPNYKVRGEALEMMLELGSASGIPALKTALKSNKKQRGITGSIPGRETQGRRCYGISYKDVQNKSLLTINL
ncbi:MAG: HEAT repeat domain-containing protein, partial [Pseudomonadota bacterium]